MAPALMAVRQKTTEKFNLLTFADVRYAASWSSSQGSESQSEICCPLSLSASSSDLFWSLSVSITRGSSTEKKKCNIEMVTWIILIAFQLCILYVPEFKSIHMHAHTHTHTFITASFTHHFSASLNWSCRPSVFLRDQNCRATLITVPIIWLFTVTGAPCNVLMVLSSTSLC